MEEIPQKELRNDVGRVLRRAEAGETLAITVAGRPVARLGPLPRGHWVRLGDIEGIWSTATPTGLASDLEDLPGGLTDPWS